MHSNDELSLVHVWNMTTQYDDYQRRLKEIQGEGEVFNIIRSEHLALSLEEQEEEMIRLREEISILKQQLEESRQKVRQSKTRLQETQVQLQETQVRLQETQDQLQKTQVQTQV